MLQALFDWICPSTGRRRKLRHVRNGMLDFDSLSRKIISEDKGCLNQNYVTALKVLALYLRGGVENAGNKHLPIQVPEDLLRVIASPYNSLREFWANEIVTNLKGFCSFRMKDKCSWEDTANAYRTIEKHFFGTLGHDSALHI